MFERPKLSDWIEINECELQKVLIERLNDTDVEGDVFLSVIRDVDRITVIMIPAYGRGIIRRSLGKYAASFEEMKEYADSVWNAWRE